MRELLCGFDGQLHCQNEMHYFPIFQKQNIPTTNIALTQFKKLLLISWFSDLNIKHNFQSIHVLPLNCLKNRLLSKIKNAPGHIMRPYGLLI